LHNNNKNFSKNELIKQSANNNFKNQNRDAIDIDYKIIKNSKLEDNTSSHFIASKMNNVQKINKFKSN